MTQSPSAPGRPAVFTALCAVGNGLDEANGAALFGLTDSQVLEGMVEVRRMAARLDAVGLRFVTEAAGRDLADRNGTVNTAGLLHDQTLMTRGKAQRRVRLAGRLSRPELAATREALRRGEIDLDQADVIADLVVKLTKAAVSADWIDAARTALHDHAANFDPSALTTLAERILAILVPDTEQDKERRNRERRGLTLRNHGDGTHGIVGCVSDTDAALIAACLDPLAVPRSGPDGAPDFRTPAARRLDALLEALNYTLRHGYATDGDDGGDDGGDPEVDDSSAEAHRAGADHADVQNQPDGNFGGTGDRTGPAAGHTTTSQKAAGQKVKAGRHRGGPQLLVLCDLKTLLDLVDGTTFGPELINGIPLTRASFERITCDATIRRLVLDPQGVPLDVGRRSRTVTPAIRAAVIVRDRKCTFPNCDRPAGWSDAHHCHHWTKGGSTSLKNIALACSFHHEKAHNGWEVRIGPHGHAEWRAPYHLDPTGTWRINTNRQPRNPFDKPLRL